MSPFPTPRASVYCKSKTSRNRGVKAEMGDPAEARARSSVPSLRLQSAGQVQPATYSRMPLRRGFQSSGAKFGICQMAGLSSRLLCVCVCARACACGVSRVGAKMRMESRAGSAFARAASSSLAPFRGSGQSPGRPAAGSRRSSATPRPYRPRPQGPDARS